MACPLDIYFLIFVCDQSMICKNRFTNKMNNCVQVPKLVRTIGELGLNLH